MLAAGLDGGSIAAIITGVIGGITGVVAAVLSYRASKSTARNEEAAAVLEAYDELVRRLREEVERQVRSNRESAARQRKRTDELIRDAEQCEERCRSCRVEIGELIAGLAALRAVVHDEVARAAAGLMIDDHQPDEDSEEAEVRSIKAFIKNLPPTPPGDPT